MPYWKYERWSASCADTLLFLLESINEVNNGEGNLLRGRRERNNASAIIYSPAGECQSLISALTPSCNCFRLLQTSSPYNANQKTFEKWKEQNVKVVLQVSGLTIPF